MDISFAEDHVRFVRYDFPGATVHPSGVLTVSQIREVDWETAPPEIRTVLGETLFVPHQQRPALELFCRRNGIAKQHRHDIWSDLLEPFLDTWFDPEHEIATEKRLNQSGLPTEEVAEIRKRVGPIMYSYNSKVWDWVHLSLFDLLNAASGSLVEPSLQTALGNTTTFYRWAMQIAERASSS